MHRHIVADGDQAPVPAGTQPDPLARRRAHADEMKDLLAGHRDLHRLVQHAGGDRCQDGLGVDAELGAEIRRRHTA